MREERGDTGFLNPHGRADHEMDLGPVKLQFVFFDETGFTHSFQLSPKRSLHEKAGNRFRGGPKYVSVSSLPKALARRLLFRSRPTFTHPYAIDLQQNREMSAATSPRATDSFPMG
jgi:hypothetical protein